MVIEIVCDDPNHPDSEFSNVHTVQYFVHTVDFIYESKFSKCSYSMNICIFSDSVWVSK